MQHEKRQPVTAPSSLIGRGNGRRSLNQSGNLPDASPGAGDVVDSSDVSHRRLSVSGPAFPAVAFPSQGKHLLPVRLVPAEPIERKTYPLAARAFVHPGRSARLIVVVDDSPTIRVLLQQCLVQAGFSTRVFADGVALLHWLTTPEACMPDLIFLDLMLPKLDGYEVAKRLKAHPALHKTALWLMSGKDSTLDQLKGRLVGAQGYLIKPFQLRKALAIALDVLKPTPERA